MSNLRIKTSINLFIDNKIISKYSDNISSIDIIRIANKIIFKLQNYKYKDILKYMVVQKSLNTDQYGIKIVLNNKINLTQNIIISLENIYLNIKEYIYIFAYQYKDKTIYISKSKRFNDIFDNCQWSYSIDSFVQSNQLSANIIHKTINSWIYNSILSSNRYYLGIGGEMGYYCSSLYNKLYNIKGDIKEDIKGVCLTNSKSIYEDNIHNFSLYRQKHIFGKIKIDIVDYKNINISKYDIDSNYTLLLNISRKGLTNLDNLKSQILSYKFKQIIYIGCSKKTIIQDFEYLNNVYMINKYRTINLDNQNIYLINFILK